MNVVVDGLMANYIKTGKGKPIIMLHGWGDDSRTFLPLAESLKQSYEIYALDLPGFGGTQKPPAAWSLDDYAAFVNNWIKKTGLKKDYFLAGHSFGGAVAIAGTANGVLKPKKMILLASAGIRGKRPLRKKVLRAAAKVGKVPLYILPPRKAENIKRRLYGRIGSDVMVVPTMRATFIKTVREDVRLKANKISVPTLLVYGSQDGQTPVPDGHILNRSIKDSRMEVIGAGHFLHHEDPEKVGKLIKEFLND